MISEWKYEYMSSILSVKVYEIRNTPYIMINVRPLMYNKKNRDLFIIKYSIRKNDKIKLQSIQSLFKTIFCEMENWLGKPYNIRSFLAWYYRKIFHLFNAYIIIISNINTDVFNLTGPSWFSLRSLAQSVLYTTQMCSTQLIFAIH